jgi:hypothetical protein
MVSSSWSYSTSSSLGALEHGVDVANTHDLALLDALERESGDESSADTRTILSGQDLHRVVALAERLAITTGLPVEDFLKSLCAALLS